MDDPEPTLFLIRMGNWSHAANLCKQRKYSSYVLGAVCPEKDKGCALVLPEVNTGMMQIHLDQISQNIDENALAIILMDRASWQTTETLIIPPNIRLMP